MTTIDMTPAIQPRSDQLNADSLRAGPLTITISGVSISPGTEQPVTVSHNGGEPWKPCKSMARVLVEAWGPDASKYVGKSLTLYRDPKVKWGGMEVGGIRISHMSDIDRDMVMVLTATKGKSAPFQVKRLESIKTKSKTTADPADPILKWAGDSLEFAKTANPVIVAKWWGERAEDPRFKELHGKFPARYLEIKTAVGARDVNEDAGE